MPKFYSATFLQSVTKQGRYRVEPGLYLSVSGTNGSAKTWMFRYQRHGHRHDAGLGAYPIVSVTEAKRLAVLARQQLGAGVDPIRERRAALRLVLPIPTFSEVADLLLEQIAHSDLNEKNRYRARLLLGPSYCGPLLDKPVNAITVTDIAGLLSAVAAKKPETSLKLHGQLRKLFQLARITLRDRNAILLAPLPTDPEDLRAAGYRPSTKSSPHPALDWREAPELMGMLRTFPGVVSQALQVLILSGLRESAVVGAEWPEIDLHAGVWTVPLDRLKDRRHRSQAMRVPISTAMHDLFVQLKGMDAHRVFPSHVPGQHLSPQSLLQMLKLRLNKGPDGKPIWTDPDTRRPIRVHGFRATLKTFGEENGWRYEVTEMALGHAVGGKVERCYRRTDLLSERAQFLQAWADHCHGASVSNVIALRG